MIVIQGASTVGLRGKMEVPLLTPMAWVTMVPTEKGQDEPPDGTYWPRERHFRVAHEVVVGTVDELTADYREKLTRGFHSLTYDGKVNPLYGEASLRQQTEVFDRNGFGGPGVKNVFRAGPPERERYETIRAAMCGIANRQEAQMRASLMHLVALYFGPDGLCVEDPETGTWANTMPPNDDPKRVQALIDALVVLKEDRERRDGRGVTLQFFEHGVTRDVLMDAMKAFEAKFGRSPRKIWLTKDMIDQAATILGITPEALVNSPLCGMLVVEGDAYAMA